MLDDGTDPPVWQSVLLLNVVAFPVRVLSSWLSNWWGGLATGGMRVFLQITTGESPCLLLLRVHFRSQEAWRDIITILQASVCSLRRDF